MSTHPNVILMAVITPNSTSRKTMRAILLDHREDEDSEDVKIGDDTYGSVVMESDYYEGYQIAAKEGDLVFFDMVTYGYGEVIKWGELEKKKSVLADWATLVCSEHDCSYEIAITANYW